jgi:hypothetical protein
MLNPSEVGKAGEHARLRTLESIWIQGKLNMWGRWSYIGEGKAGNMFNQLLTSHHVTKTAIQEALRRMKKSGITKPELEAFFMEILNGKNKSSLAFCSDEEALVIDRIISTVLAGEYDGLLNVLVQRYRYRKSKRSWQKNSRETPGTDVHDLPSHDTWLSLAESMLYAPMCDAFDTNSSRFYLQSEPVSV